MAMATKNAQVSAFTSFVTSQKDFSHRSNLEWIMAINTKGPTDREPNRPKVVGQREICELYSASRGGHCGATKRTHDINHEGKPFKHIVVKRFKTNGCIFRGEGTGNQLVDEIRCWEKLATTEDADYLCPIIKYFTCKSDKVTPTSHKVLEKVLIIAQRAEHVDDLRGACRAAWEMNLAKGLRGETYESRKAKLMDFANRMGWRDVEFNPGNSGVIFDYAANCYKAVFIDYAL